ncbi:MAG: hypothetical protein LBQ23_01090 [Puniceicoccales bacterium]|jgi:hypothetical protein|nr:hypothetical protein [Puniceicoccales bacterium]
MNIQSVCIACLLVCCCCLGWGNVSEQTGSQTIVYSLAKDDSMDFDGVFLTSSELNIAYENALGVLDEVCEVDDLKTSIATIESLSKRIPSICTEDINDFVQTLRDLVDRVSDMNQQELQDIEASLTSSYNNIAQKLNSYIVSERHTF